MKKNNKRKQEKNTMKNFKIKRLHRPDTVADVIQLIYLHFLCYYLDVSVRILLYISTLGPDVSLSFDLFAFSILT